MLADGHPRTGGVQEAHRLVGQLPGRDIAVRKLDRRLQGLIKDLHPVVTLHDRGHAAHHLDGLLFPRLGDLDHLETAGEGRVLFNIFFVFRPGGGGDGAQGAAGQGGFEEVGGIARAGGPARADQGVRLVDEENNGFLGRLHFIDNLTQPFFEFALVACPGLQQADIQGSQGDVCQRRRHVALGDAAGKSLDHRRFAHPRLAGENGIVLAPPHEDIDDLPDLVVAPHHGIDFALARPLRQVLGELEQGLLLAQSARGHGLVPGRSRHAGPQPGPVRGG